MKTGTRKKIYLFSVRRKGPEFGDPVIHFVFVPDTKRRKLFLHFHIYTTFPKIKERGESLPDCRGPSSYTERVHETVGPLVPLVLLANLR